MLLPQYLIVAAMMSIAIFPQFFFVSANKVVFSAFAIDSTSPAISVAPIINNIGSIGKVSAAFMALVAVVFGIRWLLIRHRQSVVYETWGCGYVAPVKKAQYTGQSYTRSFGLLFASILRQNKKAEKLTKEKLYPGNHSYSTRYVDILEKYFVVPLAKRLTFTLNYFQFIQNGHIQSYVLYGLFFIILVFLGTAFNIIF